MSQYDVAIVGAGPAGIFTALELVKQDNLKVLIIEKGPDLDDRLKRSEAADNSKAACDHLLCGWGGAGAFSDGKLNLSTEVGGWLSEYVGDEALENLINYTDRIYQDFGAPQKEYGVDKPAVERLKVQAASTSLTLLAGRIKHLGTEKCHEVLKKMREFLNDKVEVQTRVQVEKILVEEGKVSGLETDSGTKIEAKNVVVAPGREGADWLTGESRRLGLGLATNEVDIGVRVETQAKALKALTDVLYESKLIYYSKLFQDKVRTFCMSPYGEVTPEVYSDVITVNGHSYANRKTKNTNFALLVSTSFTKPFKEPIAYGKYIAHLANLLGGGIIIQQLGDLRKGRRSTTERIAESDVEPTLKDATPGDLSFVLPYRYISDILEMLDALDKLAPGVASPHTLLYGVEVKFYSSRLNLNSNLETKIENLYAAGDGAGITRGLVQSSCAGIIAARAILKL